MSERHRDAGGSALHRVHARTGSWQSGRTQPEAEPARPRADRSERVDDAEPSAGSQPRFHDECYACPVGSMFATARGVEPETLDRLLGAVHELLSVTRSFVDAVDKAVEAQRAARSRPSPRVRRIVVD